MHQSNTNNDIYQTIKVKSLPDYKLKTIEQIVDIIHSPSISMNMIVNKAL